uniref:phosphatidate phosphatase n=1 Tax=Denticeps clupeoides TaxID=299321 RepID=A0AAY4CZK9_9TELE
MNFVGQLAGQVFVQVKELYRGLNPATLSGCIDVIVVRQKDGSLQCSPFHVRFGKMGVFRSREKVVDIEINGEPVSLHMKLGENGEAFFVKETENDQEVIPSYLATSPILSEGPPIQTLGPSTSGDGGAGKKRRKRRRKSKVDSMKRDESGEYSEHEDMFFIDMSSNEGEDLDSSRYGTDGLSSSAFIPSPVYARSDGDWSPIQSPSASRPSSPKSDSELVTKPSDSGKQGNPAMLWAWGELPQAAKVIQVPVMFALNLSEPMKVDSELQDVESVALSAELESIRISLEHKGPDTGPLKMESEPVGAATAACLISDLDERGHGVAPRPLSKTDSPSKRKDKRSRHLGSDGVYLDDITELEPEVAALYFPKRQLLTLSLLYSDGGGPRSVSMSPQSVGSSGMDSGVDSYSDQMGDLPSIAISLCGGLTDNREIITEQFQEKAISYQQFAENPLIIDDPNLVVKIGPKYYNWSTAAPLMLAMQAFQKPLPKATIESIMKEKMPKKGSRWWFSWRGRASSTKSVGCMALRKEDSSSSDEETPAAKQRPSSVQSDPMVTTGGVSYKKTLRLSSEQLESLQLRDGPNDVVFSVTTQYQGTCRCEGTIYLWNWDDKIIISDIDGTITRSDTLGHILPTLGKDWTHQGIARLYHKVSQNGYKFLYCSARAIGMADMTRGYLHWVNERGTMLPQGPVLLSPSSLFSALHREVIEKKPEKFKVECLTDIKHLFIPLNRIFTVNPKGELVQEHAKTNVSSYERLSEVVDHVFPLRRRSSTSDFPCSDTFSHFTYWREQLPLMEGQDVHT